jgi:ABC transport system ATP-binding/permease protein
MPVSPVTLEELSLRYRGPSLLDGISARIETGDRIGLLGRNGTGKTTLMRIMAGDVVPDTGSIVLAPGVKVARLIQDVPRDWTGTVREVTLGDRLNNVDDENHWQIEHAVERTLTQMDLDPEAEFSTLSSGRKRRVLLASAISTEPQVLLLDEPTNHLDIEAILWLEQFLLKWRGTLMFITHDRTFLQNLATRIWELDRGRLFDWSCDYATFLQRKEAALAAEEKQNALFDKKLAQEEVWIRQGIKARRTRNEGRVRALKALRIERSERRNQVGVAKLNIQTAERSGALVAELKNVSFGYENLPILNDFSTTIMRGDRVGIIGPNGTGKTTLLRILLGQLAPDSGDVRLGTNLQIAYFDQLRDTLDPEQTLADNVAEGGDRIDVNGVNKHIYGYLQDFLFTPEKARTAVKFLSGGERNRALLAKLFSKPSNILVLDEPTNDLDSETLDLLEEQLAAFQGTVLMVSHDRSFLDNVVTSTIVFEPDGVREYAGGYSDYQMAITRRSDDAAAAAAGKSVGNKKPSSPANNPPVTLAAPAKKLSFKEKHELEQLPKRIETLESQIAGLHETMADPAYYQSAADRLAADATRLAEFQSQLDAAYARWAELDG